MPKITQSLNLARPGHKRKIWKEELTLQKFIYHCFLMKKKENLAQIIDQLEHWKTLALEIVLWLFACIWELNLIWDSQIENEPLNSHDETVMSRLHRTVRTSDQRTRLFALRWTLTLTQCDQESLVYHVKIWKTYMHASNQSFQKSWKSLKNKHNNEYHRISFPWTQWYWFRIEKNRQVFL